MLIGGLQKTTLIDFPGRVACTVFTVGCNFRCPFCHNKDLVTLDNFRKSGLERMSEQSFFEFLDKRKKILDGVCITGGEPTLWQDLYSICQKIKDLGLEVKLDSNGSNPKILKRLIDKKLIDFIAMDVKTAFGDYAKAILKFKTKNAKLITNIKRSIRLILKSRVEYEFRTTVVPGIHSQKNLVKLAKQLKTFNPQIIWVLQKFRPQNCLDPQYLKIKSYSDQQIDDMLKAIRKILPQTKLRGKS